jgi:hypothetical protein
MSLSLPLLSGGAAAQRGACASQAPISGKLQVTRPRLIRRLVLVPQLPALACEILHISAVKHFTTRKSALPPDLHLSLST